METNGTPEPLKKISHIFWAGCGKMLTRSLPAINELLSQGATLTFVDIKEAEEVGQQPPESERIQFFNVLNGERRDALREFLRENPITHIYVANWPSLHILTAFKYSEQCPKGTIIIAKPLDTDFDLIRTVGKNAFPCINEKMFVHDHYLNKSVVGEMYGAFPKLISSYGELNQFQLYLSEFQTIEDEGRIQAIEQGVIFDLVTHLIALIQLFFLIPPHIGCRNMNSGADAVEITINRVARARYTGCELNDHVETFSAIDVTLVVYRRNRTHSINGLIVSGKGVKPTESVEADLKGMRFGFELGSRACNFSSGTINPPLATDLPYIQGSKKETGFFRPIVQSLSQQRRHTGLGAAKEGNACLLMNYLEAEQNALLLQQVIALGANNLAYYKPQRESLREILARCVSNGALDAKWLPSDEFADIGFSE